MNPENCILMFADDDPDDREFIQEAFYEAGFKGQIRVVEDGGALMDYLKDEKGETNHPTPNLILLDLNMPKLDGYEALEKIKSDSELRKIPVIVLTTSESKEDVIKTYRLGVNSFITKPSGFEALVEMAKGINDYWLNLAELPELT